jgi:energy-converting hydrogenase Eha subunit A
MIIKNDYKFYQILSTVIPALIHTKIVLLIIVSPNQQPNNFNFFNSSHTIILYILIIFDRKLKKIAKCHSCLYQEMVVNRICRHPRNITIRIQKQKAVLVSLIHQALVCSLPQIMRQGPLRNQLAIHIK